MALQEVCRPPIAEKLTWGGIVAELAELGLMPETEAEIGRLVEELVCLLKVTEDGYYVFGEIDQGGLVKCHKSLKIRPISSEPGLGIQNLKKWTDVINYHLTVDKGFSYRVKVNDSGKVADVDFGFMFDPNDNIKNVYIGGSGRFGQTDCANPIWCADNFNATQLMENPQALRVLAYLRQALIAVEAVTNL